MWVTKLRIWSLEMSDSLNHCHCGQWHRKEGQDGNGKKKGRERGRTNEIFLVLFHLCDHKGISKYEQHLKLSPKSSVASCLFHEVFLIKIHNLYLRSLIKSPPEMRKQIVTSAETEMFHNEGLREKPRQDTHTRCFGMKMILERRDEIFTREKYGEIAHSLERAGLLLRDTGREKEIAKERKLGWTREK